MAALRGLSELPDAQIDDAIQRQEWTLALLLIEQKEKKLKKNEASDWLAACKASVLLLLPEPAKQEQGRALLDKLLEKTPTVDSLIIIQAFAEQRIDDDPRINALWLKVVNSNINDEELHKRWFKTKIEVKDWREARKAAMTYSRHFPSKREPFFWTIFANYMVAATHTMSTQERALCATMASRMCEKAAEDVPFNANMELNNTGRVLRTPSDIAFLLDVYESQGKKDEALDILNSDRTGISSRIGRCSFDLVLRKIKLLESMGRYLDLFRFCFELLMDAHPTCPYDRFHRFGKAGNEWAVWLAMYEAVKKLPQYQIQAVDYFSELSEWSSWRERKVRLWEIAQSTWYLYQNLKGRYDRNVLCAAMLFFSNNICYDGNMARNAEELMRRCHGFFLENGDKNFCFNDLQQYADKLPYPQVDKLMQLISQNINEHEQDSLPEGQNRLRRKNIIMMKVNMLKLEYCLVHSRAGGMTAGTKIEEEPAACVKVRGPQSRTFPLGMAPLSEAPAKLEAFALKCIKIHGSRAMTPTNGSSGTERFPEDDAGILAASALVRLYHLGDYQNALLRAAAILQHIITISPFNYEALVVMTMLRAKLGDGLGAAAFYHKLSVKNIQLTTVPWLLCTRISTIHPHRPHLDHSNATLKRTGEDPIEHLSQALDYYVHLRDADQRDLAGFVDAAQYSNMMEAMDSLDFPHSGFSKYMLYVEYARTARLSGMKSNAKYEALAGSLPAATWDDRDRTPVPRWEHHASVPLDEMLLPGDWPGEALLARQLMIAAAFNMTTQGNTSFDYYNVLQYEVNFARSSPSENSVEMDQFMLAMHCASILVRYDQKLPEDHARKQNWEIVTTNMQWIQAFLEKENKEVSKMEMHKERFLWCISDSIDAPDWKFFHAMYIGIDSCNLIKKLTDRIEMDNRKFRLIDSEWASEKIQTLRKLCDEYRDTVHRKAGRLREEFSDERHHSEMVHHIIGQSADSGAEDPIAGEIRGACGEEAARLLVRSLCRGWAEALKNVELITSA
ncbi:MAG: hypothetical protein Q9203_000100 [Teloschistes exilis]